MIRLPCGKNLDRIAQETAYIARTVVLKLKTRRVQVLTRAIRRATPFFLRGVDELFALSLAGNESAWLAATIPLGWCRPE